MAWQFSPDDLHQQWWKRLDALIDERIEECRKAMEVKTDPQDLHRYQGRIAELRKLRTTITTR